MTRTELSQVFILTLFALTIFGLYKLLWPFAGAIIGALTLGILFHPLQIRLRRRFPTWNPGTLSGMATALVVLFIIVPIIVFLYLAVQQSERWYPIIQSGQDYLTAIKEGRFSETGTTFRNIRLWVAETLNIQPAVQRQQLMLWASQGLTNISAWTSGVAVALAGSLVDVAIMVFTLFFVFRDGEMMYHHFESLFPFREETREELRLRMQLIVSGVIRGWMLCAILQGVTAAIGFMLGNVNGAILLGGLTTLAGLIPSVGTALVWMPVGLYQIFQGHIGQGIFVIAWGLVVVSIIDNIIRPYLVGQKTHIPFLHLFFALIGGFHLWGVKGIILGPMLVSIAPVVIHLYHQRFFPPLPVNAPRRARTSA